MAAPSNIRINPFTGTGGATTFVNFTETHIIPNTSPYVIRLNEVPQKKDPSNITVFFVNGTTGAVTTTKLREVAAAPGASQFRMDYSTNADGDEDWNTGLVEFSATDKGKIVQITYTGMGTLAGVKSNAYPAWFNDRGDGSDGDFMPTANVTISGIKNYRRVFIKSGITVTVALETRIKCQGAFINNGTVSADGKGAAGGAAVSDRSGNSGESGTIGTGGAGGAYSHTGGAGGAAVKLYVMPNDYSTIYFGSGGGSGGSRNSNSSGAGGAGGGEIVIVTKSITNKGKITANGINGGKNSGSYTAGGGGGAGGRILIICEKINDRGTITASGGIGGDGYDGNNGAKGSDGLVTITQLGVM